MFDDDAPPVHDLCTPKDLIRCRTNPHKVRTQLTEQDLKDCGDRCQDIMFSTSIDRAPFKPGVMEKEEFTYYEIAPDPTRNLTYSIILVFYSDMVSQRITLSQASLMDWLGAFGGQLSLFLGASVITILELIPLATSIAYNLLQFLFCRGQVKPEGGAT